MHRDIIAAHRPPRIIIIYNDFLLVFLVLRILIIIVKFVCISGETDESKTQIPLLLLLLIARKMHATPKAVSVIAANITIPTGHPQLRNA